VDGDLRRLLPDSDLRLWLLDGDLGRHFSGPLLGAVA
jgi:hypothetical protein